MAVGQKHLPSDSPLLSLRGFVLTHKTPMDFRVFRPSVWRSPITGAGLLGLFDLDFSPTLLVHPYAADYFFISKSPVSFDTEKSSLSRLWLTSYRRAGQ